MKTQIKVPFVYNDNKTKCSQGDILRNISIVVPTDYDVDTGDYTLTPINLQYGVVISQSCDLEHDFNSRNDENKNQDKYLPNILIVPAYSIEQFKHGVHRGEGIKGEVWSTKQMKPIKQNNNDRFHFINTYTELQIPELVIDFKHIYSINRNIFYKKLPEMYLATISELFRESLSQRYSNYTNRIGLPEIN